MTTTLEDLFFTPPPEWSPREVQCACSGSRSCLAVRRPVGCGPRRPCSAALLAPAADGTEGGVTAVCCSAADGPAANWTAPPSRRTFMAGTRASGMIVRAGVRQQSRKRRDRACALHEMSGALAAADDAGDVHIVDVGSMAAAPGATSGAIVALRGGHSSICSWVAFRPGVQTCECCTAGLDALCVRWDWRIAAKLGAWALAAPSGPFAAALAGEAAASVARWLVAAAVAAAVRAAAAAAVAQQRSSLLRSCSTRVMRIA